MSMLIYNERLGLREGDTDDLLAEFHEREKMPFFKRPNVKMYGYMMVVFNIVLVYAVMTSNAFGSAIAGFCLGVCACMLGDSIFKYKTMKTVGIVCDDFKLDYYEQELKYMRMDYTVKPYKPGLTLIKIPTPDEHMEVTSRIATKLCDKVETAYASKN